MCQEASLGPIRELGPAALRTIKAEEVRHLNEQVLVVLVFPVYACVWMYVSGFSHDHQSQALSSLCWQ